MNIIIRSKYRNWSFWHRWLGLVTCIGILMWGLSGLSHPIMTRLQPVPAQFMPPMQHLDLAEHLSPEKVLTMHGIKLVSRVSAVEFNGQTLFRVVADDENARYFSVIDGRELDHGDKLYAEYLARHYSGNGIGEITSATLIKQFSDEYPQVNRLLPVWRIEFSGAQHLRAFIDTDQARLATLSDDTRYWLTKVFRLGHNWSFLESTPRLQLAVMSTVIVAALTSAISGLVLYFKRRHAARQTKQPARRWHRRIALTVAASTLLFAGSGFFHLIMSFQHLQEKIASIKSNFIEATQLSDEAWASVSQQSISKISLTSQGNVPFWIIHLDNAAPMAQVAVMSHAHEHHHTEHADPTFSTLLVNASNKPEATELNVLQLAETIATQYAKLPASDMVSSQVISQFGGEYGFVFKRLPVVKVQFKGAGNQRFYIEPETGALAAKVEDIDALEGWSFAYLHKWEFANYNKDFRDILVALFVLGNIFTAMLGIWLFSRR